ncbi:hypothetical protein J6590_023435 [Homalodisca vitripennis]|nr:hypothetical protein J6590_023435 [Homalodisca vitripennis]
MSGSANSPPGDIESQKLEMETQLAVASIIGLEIENTNVNHDFAENVTVQSDHNTTYVGQQKRKFSEGDNCINPTEQNPRPNASSLDTNHVGPDKMSGSANSPPGDIESQKLEMETQLAVASIIGLEIENTNVNHDFAENVTVQSDHNTTYVGQQKRKFSEGDNCINPTKQNPRPNASSLDTNHVAKRPNIRRLRLYNESNKGPYEVIIQSRDGKKINPFLVASKVEITGVAYIEPEITEQEVISEKDQHLAEKFMKHIVPDHVPQAEEISTPKIKNTDHILEENFTMTELIAVLKTKKKDTAPGNDLISYSMITHLLEEALNVLLNI